VRLNTQPATQTTGFSDFQPNEADSSTQSILAPSDFPTVFPHKTTPSTSVIQTASTGRTVKAASLSPLPSIAKQRTSDARSSRPGSTKIIAVSPFKVELEKKRGVQSTDTDKKLTCHKSLCEKHIKKQKENSKTGPLSGGKSRPIKPMVKTEKSGVKTPISPSSAFGVSSGSEDDDG
jgi:hypothetical protein